MSPLGDWYKLTLEKAAFCGNWFIYKMDKCKRTFWVVDLYNWTNQHQPLRHLSAVDLFKDTRTHTLWLFDLYENMALVVFQRSSLK